MHEAAKKCDRVPSDCAKPIDWPRTDEWFASPAYPDDATMKKVRGNRKKYGIKPDGKNLRQLISNSYKKEFAL
jgi:hypothetical protein